jgi:hypothetical protein
MDFTRPARCPRQRTGREEPPSNFYENPDNLISACAGVKALERIERFLSDAVTVASNPGVKVVSGTDFFHREEHGHDLEDLAYLHAAGLTTQEVLLAATRTAAEHCGIAEGRSSFGTGCSMQSCLAGTPATWRSLAIWNQ